MDEVPMDEVPMDEVPIDKVRDERERWGKRRVEGETGGEGRAGSRNHATSNEDSGASSSNQIAKEVQVNALMERPVERCRETVVQNVVVVDRQVPVPWVVERLVTVEVPVPVPVLVPVQVPVYTPVTAFVEVKVPYVIDRPVIVDRPVPVPLILDRPVPVDRPVIIGLDPRRAMRGVIRAWRLAMMEMWDGDAPQWLLQTGAQAVRQALQHVQAPRQVPMLQAPPDTSMADTNMGDAEEGKLLRSTRLASERTPPRNAAQEGKITEVEDSPPFPEGKRQQLEDTEEESTQERRSTRAKVRTVLFQSQQVEEQEQALKSQSVSRRRQSH
jgi:hypothetical protein